MTLARVIELVIFVARSTVWRGAAQVRRAAAGGATRSMNSVRLARGEAARPALEAKLAAHLLEGGDGYAKRLCRVAQSKIELAAQHH